MEELGSTRSLSWLHRQLDKEAFGKCDASDAQTLVSMLTFIYEMLKIYPRTLGEGRPDDEQERGGDR